MADKKISALTGATTPLAGTEVLPIVQSGATVKVANNDLRPKQIQSNATSGVLQVAGPASAATRVMTTPDANFTAARTDAAQVLTGDQSLTAGNIVQVTANKGFNFTANTPAAGMTSQLLNDYEEGTGASAACTGAITTAAVWKIAKNGAMVTLLLPDTTGTATAAASFAFGTVLPAKYRPSGAFLGTIPVYDNGVIPNQPGMVLINGSTGVITIFKDLATTGVFTAAPGAGIPSIMVSWIVS